MWNKDREIKVILYCSMKMRIWKADGAKGTANSVRVMHDLHVETKEAWGHRWFAN